MQVNLTSRPKPPDSPAGEPPPPIQIYAELLPNIRSISLLVTLHSDSNTSTRAVLAANGSTLTVSHDGQSASIQLPVKMGGGGEAALAIPQARGKELEMRLQLQEREPGLLVLDEDDADVAGGNEVPWMAGDMRGAEIACQSCDAVLVRPDAVGDWRDLPSEDWAEMMDLWHCHRPPDEDGDGSAKHSKGYAAGSGLDVKAGTAFVSTAYFLLAAEDVSNVEASSHSANPPPSSTAPASVFQSSSTLVPLQCSSCQLQLGTTSPDSDTHTLLKPAISVKHTSSDDATRRAYPLEKWFTARLLGIVEREAVRRVRLRVDEGTPSSPSSQPDDHDEDDADNDELLLWIFTDDLRFSSSRSTDLSASPPAPTRAIKVLWKPQGAQATASSPGGEMAAALTAVSLHVEELFVPRETYVEVRRRLVGSAEALPVGMRVWQGWSVGLLRRFVRTDWESSR